MVCTVVCAMIGEYAYQLWYPSNTAYASFGEFIRFEASVRATLMNINEKKNKKKTRRMTILATVGEISVPRSIGSPALFLKQLEMKSLPDPIPYPCF